MWNWSTEFITLAGMYYMSTLARYQWLHWSFWSISRKIRCFSLVFVQMGYYPWLTNGGWYSGKHEDSYSGKLKSQLSAVEVHMFAHPRKSKFNIIAFIEQSINNHQGISFAFAFVPDANLTHSICTFQLCILNSLIRNKVRMNGWILQIIYLPFGML